MGPDLEREGVRDRVRDTDADRDPVAAEAEAVAARLSLGSTGSSKKTLCDDDADALLLSKAAEAVCETVLPGDAAGLGVGG